MGMVIIAAGMRRSGSTLQYQLLGDVLRSAGVAHESRWMDHIDPVELDALLSSGQTCILKTHRVAPALTPDVLARGLLVFYSSRDPRDCLISSLHKYAKSFSPEAADRMLSRMESEFDFWTSLPLKGWSRYENLRNDMPGEIKRLAVALGVSLTDEQVAELASARSLDSQKDLIGAIDWESRGTRMGMDLIDTQTLLHANHIRDGGLELWSRELSSSALAGIESRFGDFIRKAGYQLGTTKLQRSIHALRRLGTRARSWATAR